MSNEGDRRRARRVLDSRVARSRLQVRGLRMDSKRARRADRWVRFCRSADRRRVAPSARQSCTLGVAAMTASSSGTAVDANSITPKGTRRERSARETEAATSDDPASRRPHGRVPSNGTTLDTQGLAAIVHDSRRVEVRRPSPNPRSRPCQVPSSALRRTRSHRSSAHRRR